MEKSYLENHKGKMPSICDIATNNKWNDITWGSYGGGGSRIVKMDRVPHVSQVICNEESTNADTTSNSENYNSPTSIQSNNLRFQEKQGIILLKSARTGSTFFTDTLTTIMRKTDHPVSQFWKPFSSGRCMGKDKIPAADQERSLNILLKKNCNLGHDKCHPTTNCKPTFPKRTTGEAINIFAANPRFFDADLDWSTVIEDVKNVNVFSLRRTNLVLMAYSKFHHGGCGSGASVEFPLPPFPTKKGKTKKGSQAGFIFDVMLACIYHYTVYEQELSISTAFHVSSLTTDRKEPFIAAYEDVIQNKKLMEEQILMFLGLDTQMLNKKNLDDFDSSKQKKLHTGSFCDNKDVNCEQINEGFAAAINKYPCLERQLHYSDDGDTWSMPMLEDGTISMHGDCFPLPVLERGTHERRFAKEFYSIM